MLVDKNFSKLMSFFRSITSTTLITNYLNNSGDDRAHASKPLQKCKSLKVRQASIICKGVYPHTKERTPSSPSPLPPKRPPRAMNRSLEQVCRAPSSLSQIQKLAFWPPTTVNGRHSKKNIVISIKNSLCCIIGVCVYWRMYV